MQPSRMDVVNRRLDRQDQVIRRLARRNRRLKPIGDGVARGNGHIFRVLLVLPVSSAEPTLAKSIQKAGTAAPTFL